MNRKVADILFVLFLFVGMVTYLFYTQSYRIILSGQVWLFFFLATTDFFTLLSSSDTRNCRLSSLFSCTILCDLVFRNRSLDKYGFSLGTSDKYVVKTFFTESRYRILFYLFYIRRHLFGLYIVSPIIPCRKI